MDATYDEVKSMMLRLDDALRSIVGDGVVPLDTAELDALLAESAELAQRT